MDDADCGINPVTGDKMGHNHRGLCMAQGCYKVVDHGLANVCGGDHGGAEYGCGKYFCDDHLDWHLCSECWREFAPQPSYTKTVLTTFYDAGRHRPLPFPDDDDSSDS